MRRLSICFAALLLSLLAPSIEKTYAKDVPYAEALVPNILKETKVGDWALFEYSRSVERPFASELESLSEELWVVEAVTDRVILIRCRSPIIGEYFLQRSIPPKDLIHPQILVHGFTARDSGLLRTKPEKLSPWTVGSGTPHIKEREPLVKTSVETKGNETHYHYGYELSMEKVGMEKRLVEMKLSGSSLSGLALLKIVNTNPRYTDPTQEIETIQRKRLSSGSAGSTPPEPKALDTANERKTILSGNPFEKARVGTLTFDVTKRMKRLIKSKPEFVEKKAVYEVTLSPERKLSYKKTSGDYVAVMDSYKIDIPDSPGVLQRPFLWAGKLIPLLFGSTQGGLPLVSASQSAVKVKLKGENLNGIQIKMRFAKGQYASEYDITFIPEGPTGLYALKRKSQISKDVWDEIEFTLAK